MTNQSKQRVIIGLSGGVDSSVAAWLLLQQGYSVEGLFMSNWDEDDSYCTAAQDFQDARQVCAELEIPLHRVNFATAYKDRVFSHFLAEYAAGRTPNPDVLCNREIKFDLFFHHARRLGADWIATGHYARLDHSKRTPRLLTSRDRQKDQTYFLHAAPTAALARTLFPLGDLIKAEVRQMATDAGFANHAKKDSTGICFIGERDFTEFLSRYLPTKPGKICTPEGDELGFHQGIMYYTLGQRQGLGIGGQVQGNGRPWYVADKQVDSNTLIVVQGDDHPLLYHDVVITEPVTWLAGKAPSNPLHCQAKLRYRGQATNCQIDIHPEGYLNAIFDQPQWAVTPGQSLVLYDGEECLGGAVITTRDWRH